MDLGSVFLILALLVLVGLYIGRPLFERREVLAASVETDAQDHEYSHLMAERDRIINALQELDFDYGLGKIPVEDYPGQRTVLLQRGADVLRQLDALSAPFSGPAQARAGDEESRLEAAIAARRADAAAQGKMRAGLLAGNGRSIAAHTPDDDVEALLAQRRRLRGEKAAGFCPQCGGPVQKSDRFCPKCGQSLV